MSELNPPALIAASAPDMVEKPLDWTDIVWREEEQADADDEEEEAEAVEEQEDEAAEETKSTDAQTQTDPAALTQDRETQTSHPFILRMDLERAPSRLRCASLKEVEGLAAPLLQFNRQAPARISTSPTLRRMRSTRLSARDAGRADGPTEELGGLPEVPSPTRSPSAATFRQISPLALSPGPAAEQPRSAGPELAALRGNAGGRWRSQTVGGGAARQEPVSANAHAGVTPGTGEAAEDADQGTGASHGRLQERRRSSVVVSLPGLDVSPGDLFVTNGAADMLSTYSDTKKSKWPFPRRGTTKAKTRTSADIEKRLATIQVQEWRDTNFQRYKDSSLEEFLREQPDLHPAQEARAYRQQEAIWELFTSECVYFLDQLMVLKEVFLTPLSELQARDCLQDIEPWRLFANLNELCLVSFGFLTSLLRVVKETWSSPGASNTQTLTELLQKVFGESVCHCLQKYCLNYSAAVLCVDTLRSRDDFSSFVKWCERQAHCRRLQLKDLLVVPLQRFTRYPLLLRNIRKRTEAQDDQAGLQGVAQQVDRAICDLEGKVKWLDNYQKVKQLRECLVWPPVWERNKRVHVPESLRHLLKAVSLENLISQRTLLHEGKLTLSENTKLQEVYLFLFDEFLLITKIKRGKKRSSGSEPGGVRPAAAQELSLLLQDGCTFTVLDQPVSLDRLQLRNIDQINVSGSGLPHSFILTHQNRYQQCVGVFILQAQSESVKRAWMSEIEDAVATLLKQDSQHPRLSATSSWLESSQI